MHLADGILTEPALVAGLDLAGAGALGVAIREITDDGERQLALTGTLAAFVLVAQAINVPLVPGASAHVIGASLLTLLVGPARAIVALSAVLLAQAVLLADGGVVVIGLNILNIAVLPVLVVHAARRLIAAGNRRLGLAAVVGTMLGNAAGAASLAGTLVFGAAADPVLAFGWLVGIQTAAGLLEGLLTAAAVGKLARLAPHLVAHPRGERQSRPSTLRTIAWGAVAVGIAIALLPLASAHPDALERVTVGREAPR